MNVLTRSGRFDPSHGLWRGALILLLSIGWVGTKAQTSPERCTVAGAVTSGGAPLPGVAITAVSADGRDVAATATEPTGVYQLHVPGPGTYGIRAELSAFAPINRQVTLTAEACSARLDLPLAQGLLE